MPTSLQPRDMAMAHTARTGLCPLSAGLDGPTPVPMLQRCHEYRGLSCCSENEDHLLDKEFSTVWEGVFAGCPGCLENYRQLVCAAQCSPTQKDFVVYPNRSLPAQKGKPVVQICPKMCTRLYNSCANTTARRVSHSDDASFCESQVNSAAFFKFAVVEAEAYGRCIAVPGPTECVQGVLIERDSQKGWTYQATIKAVILCTVLGLVLLCCLINMCCGARRLGPVKTDLHLLYRPYTHAPLNLPQQRSTRAQRMSRQMRSCCNLLYSCFESCAGLCCCCCMFCCDGGGRKGRSTTTRQTLRPEDLMAHAQQAKHDEAQNSAPPPLMRVRFRPRSQSTTSERGRADSSQGGIESAGPPHATDGTGVSRATGEVTGDASESTAVPQSASSKREEKKLAAVNFTGDYEIDYRPNRSQSPDLQMGALGFHYFSPTRIAARSFWTAQTVTIEHDPVAMPFPVWQETIQAGVVYSSTDELLLDGLPRRTIKAGYEVEVTNTVEDGGAAVTTRIVYLTRPGFVTDIRRTMIAHDPQYYQDKTYKCVNTLTRPGEKPLIRESYYVLSR